MKLTWTPIAQGHSRAAYEYIAFQNVDAADALVDRILSVVDMLEQYPQMGRTGRVMGTKEIVIAGTQFVVAYRLSREQIDVLALFHTARRWPEKF